MVLAAAGLSTAALLVSLLFTDVPGASTPIAAAMRLSASDEALARVAGVTTSMIGAGWRLYDQRNSDLRRSPA